jgi:hypothetical protein
VRTFDDPFIKVKAMSELAALRHPETPRTGETIMICGKLHLVVNSVAEATGKDEYIVYPIVVRLTVATSGG